MYICAQVLGQDEAIHFVFTASDELVSVCICLCI